MFNRKPAGDFTLDDFKKQFEHVKKIGMKEMIGRMPGMEGMVPEGEDPGKSMDRIIRMIDAMTKEERQNPDIIGQRQLQRIAADSCTSPQAVEQFLGQFEQVRELMRQMAKMSMFDRLKLMTGLGKLPAIRLDDPPRNRIRGFYPDDPSEDNEFEN